MVTSAHKLIYGHYLAEKGNDIVTCLSLGKLKEADEAWLAEMQSQQQKLASKRQ